MSRPLKSLRLSGISVGSLPSCHHLHIDITHQYGTPTDNVSRLNALQVAIKIPTICTRMFWETRLILRLDRNRELPAGCSLKLCAYCVVGKKRNGNNDLPHLLVELV